jgi:hypothetical protein
MITILQDQALQINGKRQIGQRPIADRAFGQVTANPIIAKPFGRFDLNRGALVFHATNSLALESVTIMNWRILPVSPLGGNRRQRGVAFDTLRHPYPSAALVGFGKLSRPAQDLAEKCVGGYTACPTIMIVSRQETR